LEPLLAPLHVDEPEPVENKGKSNQKHATIRQANCKLHSEQSRTTAKHSPEEP
jgi:hypothetical protein